MAWVFGHGLAGRGVLPALPLLQSALTPSGRCSGGRRSGELTVADPGSPNVRLVPPEHSDLGADGRCCVLLRVAAHLASSEEVRFAGASGASRERAGGQLVPLRHSQARAGAELLTPPVCPRRVVKAIVRVESDIIKFYCSIKDMLPFPRRCENHAAWGGLPAAV